MVKSVFYQSLEYKENLVNIVELMYSVDEVEIDDSLF